MTSPPPEHVEEAHASASSTASESAARRPHDLLARAWYLGLARVAVLGARALLFVLLGRALPPERYGAVGVLATLGGLAALLLDAGATSYLIREGATHDGTHAAFAAAYRSRLRALPVLGAAYFLTSFFMLGQDYDLLLAALLGGYFLVAQLAGMPLAYLRGIGRARYEGLALLGLHGTELLTMGLWSAAGGQDPIWLLATLVSLRAICLHLALRTVPRSPTGVLVDFRMEWRKSLPFAGASLASFVHAQVDVLLLQLLRGPAEVGLYWAAYRLMALAVTPVDILIMAAGPLVARMNSAGSGLRELLRDVHSLGITWILPALTGIFTFSGPLLVTVFGPEHGSSAELLRVLCFAMLVAYTPPYGSFLLLRPNPAPISRALLTSAALNIAANLALIPFFGMYGAAWSTAISYGLIKLLFANIYRKQRLWQIPGSEVAWVAALSAAWSAWVASCRPSVIVGTTVIAVGTLLTSGYSLWRLRR